MIFKEDVVSWFKELESYKRIDTMCTLLNMCLPFELRFLGTVLEELGRRDAQELRGIELRVNNSQELSADIASCQSGEPTDIKLRRKMAMFLALIRSCNRPCVNELFKTLDGWGERDFGKIGDSDTLQELLLVYTMSSNHPIFSFEQRMKCGEIFNKINDSSTSYQHENFSIQQSHHITNPIPMQQSTHPTLPPQTQMLNQPTQMRWELLPNSQISQIISGEGIVGQQVAIDPNSQLPLSVDFGVPPPAWNIRHHIQQMTPSPVIENLQFSMAQQPPSPMLSQPSSPVHSRTASPSRINQQNTSQTQLHRNNTQRNLRTNRRPSVDTTPPPLQNVNLGVITNDVLVPQQNVNYDDISYEALSQLHNLYRNGYTRPGHHTIPRQSKTNHIQQHQQHYQNNAANYNQTNLGYNLQNLSLIDVNQVVDSNSRKKSGGSDSGSSIGSVGEISPPETPHMSTNNTPNSFQAFKQQHLSFNRINGRPDTLAGGTIIFQRGNHSPQLNQNYIAGNNELIVGSSNILTNNNNNGNICNNNQMQNNVMISATSVSSTSTGTTLLTNPILVQQPQQQFSATYPYQQHMGSSTRPLLPHPNSFRHPTIAGTEIIYPYQMPTAQTITFIPPNTSLRSSPSTIIPQANMIQTVAPATYQPNKLSCFNCGAQTHTGRDCQEASMEDVTRGSIYKLDYNAATSPSTSSQQSTSVTDSTLNIEKSPTNPSSSNSK